jgi:hypothetical protein
MRRRNTGTVPGWRMALTLSNKAISTVIEFYGDAIYHWEESHYRLYAAKEFSVGVVFGILGWSLGQESWQRQGKMVMDSTLLLCVTVTQESK